jgi:hypothetical protein
VTALVTPSLQDGAAGTGAHALTEAMLLGAAAIIRLVGALHAALLDDLAQACGFTRWHDTTTGSTNAALRRAEPS